MSSIRCFLNEINNKFTFKNDINYIRINAVKGYIYSRVLIQQNEKFL